MNVSDESLNGTKLRWAIENEHRRLRALESERDQKIDETYRTRVEIRLCKERIEKLESLR